MPHPHPKLSSLLAMRNGATNVENSSIIAKRLRLNMELTLLMVFIVLKLHLNVRRKTTNSRFPTQRSCTLYLVRIVARKSVKSGRSNSGKRSRERMSSTSANRENCLNRREEKWKEKDSIINTINTINSTKGITGGIPPLRRPHKAKVVLVVVVRVHLLSIITKLLKSR